MLVNNKEMIKIIDSNGTETEVEVVTYLVSDDKTKNYLVYTKNESNGSTDDKVIYISRIFKDNQGNKLEEIVDDNEWASVQNLLKKIANVD